MTRLTFKRCTNIEKQTTKEIDGYIHATLRLLLLLLLYYCTAVILLREKLENNKTARASALLRSAPLRATYINPSSRPPPLIRVVRSNNREKKARKSKTRQDRVFVHALTKSPKSKKKRERKEEKERRERRGREHVQTCESVGRAFNTSVLFPPSFVFSQTWCDGVAWKRIALLRSSPSSSS